MTYTDEEVRLLAGLPQLIGMAAASASGSDAIGTVKELTAGATSLLAGWKSYPENAIIRQILPDPATGRSGAAEWAESSREWVSRQVPSDGRLSRESLATAALQAAEAASAVLSAKASPAKAGEYREWVLSVAERVVKASSEGGVLGFGGNRVATEEREFVDQLRLALGHPGHLAGRGVGRMAGESAQRTGAVDGARLLTGRKVIVTAGPTHEALGNGTYIGSCCKGVNGYALAEAAVALGAETILVSGPVNLHIPRGAQLMMVDDAENMLQVCERELPCDIVVHAAAVAPWRHDRMSRDQAPTAAGSERLNVSLTRTPDILAIIASRGGHRPSLVVGMMTGGDDSDSAEARLRHTQADLVVVGELTDTGGSALFDRRTLRLVAREGTATWSNLTMSDFARRLMEELAAALARAVQ